MPNPVAAEPATPPATEGVPSPRRRRRRALAPYLFSAPAMLLYLLFTVIPIGYALVTSFFAQRRVGGGPLGTRSTVFVWFDNYAGVLDDPRLIGGLGRLALYGIIAVPFTLGLALLFALLLDTPGVKLRRFGRTAIFLPYAVPGVVAALMWGFMYLAGTSPFSHVTRSLGWGDIPFLEPGGIYPSLANISIWGGTGFNMLIIYTALRGIPPQLIEAARLDGAGEVQIALRIKVPMVGPALILTSIFGLLGALQLYGEPLMLKPLTNTISTTWAPLMAIYQDAFVLDNLHDAAAASIVLAVGTALVSTAVLATVRIAMKRRLR
ncbi:carbohydrate ABC transporter permease [Streptomyces zingiberis]|uniref:Sugar ABC transporter permease n=1 Tax=Streptomyces zingiberis TaxID=2053010 RepID=A0ABX1C760_9ACTN|nr:sugar ABC transporter permease [Streptomyces zingiberis]NJQ02794.1 sugar ABC transporter permease [Streptomyces zingiberis]